MAEDTKTGGGLAGAVPISVVLAILASLFFTNSLPYKEERPSIRPIQAKYRAAQDVDARLWQDPFAAVEEANDEMPKQKVVIESSSKNNTLQLEATPVTTQTSHGPNQIYNGDPAKFIADSKISVVAVTLLGSPYQEAAEHRMRWRYAVLSGLANQGYIPDDEQHIGYFHVTDEVLQMDEALQKKVAFEWWSANDGKKKLLLLWLDESNLLEYPLKRLNVLLSQAVFPIKDRVLNYAVIGPNTSTLLRDMLNEVGIDKGDASKCLDLQIPDKPIQTLGAISGKSIVFYAAVATSSDRRLLDDVFDSKETCGTVSEYLLKHNVKLHRITPHDRDMMDILVAELRLRQVENSDHVVVLSEWDSFYGRAMPLNFKNAWGNEGKDDNGQKVVHGFGYMRGLDGILPDKGNKAAVADKKPDIKDKSEVAASIEPSEGRSQKDYIRRLAGYIVELDLDFKNQGYSKGVAAIGVLGSDVHDKMLILEALRPYFPHKLFFTTDLDAAYNHPAKRPQAHNLLVASAFDLKLRNELQGDIPPFRDAYQTAMFLASQLAVNVDKISHGQLCQIDLRPRLFEIGRNHPIPLPTSQQDLTVMHNNCSWKEWLNCINEVHPKVVTTPQFKLSWKTGLYVLDLIVTIAFLYFVSTLFRKWAKESYDYCKSNMIQVIKITCGFLVVCCLMIFAWWFYSSQYYAEPFYWFEGVSIWPSQLLRLLIVPVAWGFWFWGDLRIKEMQKELQKEDGDEKSFALSDQPNTTGPSYWDRIFVGDWKKKEGDPQTVDPNTLWKKYLAFLDNPCCKKRVIWHLCIFFVTALLVICQIGGFPNTPARSVFAIYVNKALIVAAVLSTLSLTIWVVEHARLCERFIDELSDKPSRWHQDATDWAIFSKHVAPESANDWLDIKLVAKLTATIQPLIFGPVVCIALLLVARSPVIDDWDIPLGLKIVFATLLLYAILVEVFLQHGAKSARKKAIDLLSNKISIQRNLDEPNDVVIKRIEAEIERIKDLREGAFRPWYEWPLISSFGGLGTLWVALQYFAEFWGQGSL